METFHFTYFHFFYLLFTFSYFIIFHFCYKKLAKFLNLYDIPDFNRKLHKKKIPLIGGLLIYIFFIFISLIDYYFLKIFSDFLYLNNKEFISLIIFSSIFFFLGIVDDKFVLSADKKLFLYFFLILSFLALNDLVLIKFIKFSFVQNYFYLGYFSFFFTALSILLFLNSLNMFDGINLQSGFYSIFFLIILFFKFNYSLLFLILIIVLLFFLFLNFQNKIFMGESGINFIGIFLSYFVITAYNREIITYSDEIFLIMSILGFDLLRLALVRIFSGKHPFKADKNHIHHRLIKKFSIYKTYLILVFIIIFPYILFLIYKNILLSIIISLFFYILVILKTNSKKFNHLKLF
jgi:UDP-GlcNAc:undecaprenyl-phosphate GlcNAc-1-phosphate transferase